jgi:ribonuclease-3
MGLAFVHASAAREGTDGEQESNERLEFLGDAVIGYTVARYLYDTYPGADEGELALRKSALVSDAALAPTAERLGFGKLLLRGAGEAKRAEPGRTMLADSFEAFVAALARAAGLEAAAAFVLREHVAPAERAQLPIGDPKTMLQEWAQREVASPPAYADRFEGPPHERTFHARVWVGGEWLAEGTGASKKEAQRAAAARAIEVLRGRNTDVGSPRLSAPLKSPRLRAAKTRAK